MKRLAILLLALPMAVSAMPIRYNVDTDFGGGASVSGYFETDGTIGVIGQANIVDAFLTLTSTNLAGGSPQTISFADSNLFIGGSSFVSTVSNLLWNFDGNSNDAFFIQSLLGQVPYYGLSNRDVCGGGCIGGEFIGWNLGITGPAEFIARQGLFAFASVSTVPEPSTLALFGIGLFAIGLARRRRAR